MTLQYIVDTIQSRPLFQWLTIQEDRFWRQLLFLDHVSIAGANAKQVLELISFMFPPPPPRSLSLSLFLNLSLCGLTG